MNCPNNFLLVNQFNTTEHLSYNIGYSDNTFHFIVPSSMAIILLLLNIFTYFKVKSETENEQKKIESIRRHSFLSTCAENDDLSLLTNRNSSVLNKVFINNQADLSKKMKSSMKIQLILVILDIFITTILLINIIFMSNTESICKNHILCTIISLSFIFFVSFQNFFFSNCILNFKQSIENPVLEYQKLKIKLSLIYSLVYSIIITTLVYFFKLFGISPMVTCFLFIEMTNFNGFLIEFFFLILPFIWFLFNFYCFHQIYKCRKTFQLFCQKSSVIKLYVLTIIQSLFYFLLIFPYFLSQILGKNDLNSMKSKSMLMIVFSYFSVNSIIFSIIIQSIVRYVFDRFDYLIFSNKNENIQTNEETVKSEQNQGINFLNKNNENTIYHTQVNIEDDDKSIYNYINRRFRSQRNNKKKIKYLNELNEDDGNKEKSFLPIKKTEETDNFDKKNELYLNTENIIFLNRKKSYLISKSREYPSRNKDFNEKPEKAIIKLKKSLKSKSKSVKNIIKYDLIDIFIKDAFIGITLQIFNSYKEEPINEDFYIKYITDKNYSIFDTSQYNNIIYSISNQAGISEIISKNAPIFLEIIEFSPKIFSTLRFYDDLSYDEFKTSFILSDSLQISSSNGGNSESLFIPTSDSHFLLKTISNQDFDVLFDNCFLLLYLLHMKSNRNSLLCRIYGVYTLRNEDKGDPVKVVILRNLKGPFKKLIRSIFDVKGSTMNREVKIPENIIGTFKECLVVKKDLNFNKEVGKLNLKEKDVFLEIIKKDVEFLLDQGIMDYSLFIFQIKYSDTKLEKIKSSQSFKSYKKYFFESFNTSSDDKIKDNEGKISLYNSTDQYCKENPLKVGYLIMIIDYFQKFTINKMMEKNLKNLFKSGVASSAPPNEYAKRFMTYVTSIA